ncbi:hypothetical protein ACVWW7_001684 [Bradyrhizobium sp. LM6.9]
MPPRRFEPGRCCGALTAFSALVLLADGGDAFAQNAGTSRELPPVQVSGDETRPHKKPAVARRAGKPVRSNGRIVVDPTATQAPNARSVASGVKGPPGMASEITVSGEEINARPFARPGEALEAVPGLIVTQHSGEGKANQYFLRGYNLDHGTDLAITVDGVPVNMRTHAHGQGYADLNWLIPETIAAIDVRKGPYFADEGDFASVGSVHIGLIDRTKGLAQVTAGSFGYRRLLGMDSAKVGDGSLLVAGELGTYNGPWDNPDNVRKLNGLVRYSQGTATDGVSVTGMAYANKWNFDRPGAAARDRDRPARPVRLGGSKRRRQHQSLRALGPHRAE